MRNGANTLGDPPAPLSHNLPYPTTHTFHATLPSLYLSLCATNSGQQSIAHRAHRSMRTVRDELEGRCDAMVASVEAQAAEEVKGLRAEFETMVAAFLAGKSTAAPGAAARAAVAVASEWSVTLTVLAGPHAGLTTANLALREGEPVRIGRKASYAASGGLSLPLDSSVSEEHAEIAVSGATCTFTDDSSNGSFVDGVDASDQCVVLAERVVELVLGQGDESAGVAATKVRCTLVAPGDALEVAA